MLPAVIYDIAERPRRLVVTDNLIQLVEYILRRTIQLHWLQFSRTSTILSLIPEPDLDFACFTTHKL